ncbi:TPA: DUF2178 domain-containing protein [Candidatus Woesearchaeota archaeon]|nr:DUF2178 domain-containing protein [Candidatus Woesearchaeota archaeon]
MKSKNQTVDRGRLIAIMIVGLLVVVTGTLFSVKSIQEGNIAGGVGGALIALIILGFAIIVYVRGQRDMVKGFPLQDERSRRVMEKASSRAFYVSLYVLLAIGFLSEDWIPFRDVSQATSVAVGCMALLFAIFWAYYERKEM